MAVTQYIGARYVPKFADPYDWDDTREYEPLTVVYSNGNSYTSKQYVPKGIPLTDESYWALTGNYNAQVEQYRKETQAVSAKYDTVVKISNDALSLAQTNEKDIASNDAELSGTADSGLKTLITEETERAKNEESSIDSKLTTEVERATSAENTLSNTITSEIDRAKVAESKNKTAIQNEVDRATAEEQKNATAIENETKRAKAREDELDGKISKSGYNIITIGDSYSKAESELNTWPYWLHQLDNSVNVNNFGVSGAGFNVANKLFYTQLINAHNNIKDPDSINYIVIAGGRNDIMDESTAISRIDTICNDAHTWFPNARIIIVPMLWHWTSISQNELNKITAISRGGYKNGADVIMGAWIWGKAKKDHYQTNDIHPNNKGAKLIAGYILSAIKGTYCPRYEQGSYKWGDAHFDCVLHDNLVTVNIAGDMPSYADTNYPAVFSPQKAVNAIGFTNAGTAFGIFFFSPESNSESCKCNIFGKSGGAVLGNIGCSITYPA